MKKIFVAALIALSFTTSAFADNTKVNSRVLNNFNQEFASASQVEWVVNSEFAKASFLFEGQKVEAFYNFNGTLVGTSRALAVNQLPSRAQETLADKYAGYTVKESIVFDKVEEGLFYYVSLENDKNKVILEITASGDASIMKKTRK